MSRLLQHGIRTFLSILAAHWQEVHDLAHRSQAAIPQDMISDWMQSSWEMVVEAALSHPTPVYLEVYGEGADCNTVGSRVLYPEVKPTHAVHVVPTQGDLLRDCLTNRNFPVPAEGLLLDQFVSLSNGWYEPVPPFDHALVFVEGVEQVVLLDDVSFVLVEISRSGGET